MYISVNELMGQFVLSQIEKYIPTQWNIKQINSWILATHPSLPVVPIHTSQGKSIGWFLGYALSKEGVKTPPGIVVLDTEDNICNDENIEKLIYSFTGRYIAVILQNNIQRLYMDPLGSLASVYSEIEPIVASTPTLIGYEWNYDLIDQIDFPEYPSWFPCGLTSQKKVKRLVPNNYLDLNNMKAIRHWPKTKKLITSTIEEKVNDIGAALKSNVETISKEYPLQLSITGGRDSRMILAACKNVIDSMELFTYYTKSVNSSYDSYIASQIVEINKLNHKFIQFENSSDDDLIKWQIITGYSASEGMWRYNSTSRHLSINKALMTGAEGGIGKTFYYKTTDTENMDIDYKDIAKRLKLPCVPAVEHAVSKWLEGLNGYHPYTILDLMYCELRMGCWSSPQYYALDKRSIFQAKIMNNRKIINDMISLPIEYRKRKQLHTDICAQLWPELLEFPFNKYPGLLGYQKQMLIIVNKISEKMKYRFQNMRNAHDLNDKQSNHQKWFKRCEDL